MGDWKGTRVGMCVWRGGLGLAGAGGVMLLMRAETAATSQSNTSKRERDKRQGQTSPV